MLCYIMLRYVTLRYVMLRYVTLGYVMLCCVMLYYVISGEHFLTGCKTININLFFRFDFQVVRKYKTLCTCK